MPQAGTAVSIADVISDLSERWKSGRLPQGSFLSFPTGYGFRVWQDNRSLITARPGFQDGQTASNKQDVQCDQLSAYWRA
jgi:hypothetical protein